MYTDQDELCTAKSTLYEGTFTSGIHY